MFKMNHNASITGFIAALAVGHIGDETFLIKKELAEKVLDNMVDEVFIKSSVEAGESGELAYGYDVLIYSSENFYLDNRELALDLIENTVMKVRHPNSHDSLLASVKSMFDEHIYPKVENQHIQKILDGYVLKASDCEGLEDAFSIVSYQVVSHCIMETCYAYNTYLASVGESVA